MDALKKKEGRIAQNKREDRNVGEICESTCKLLLLRDKKKGGSGVLVACRPAYTRCLAPVNSEREIYHNNKTNNWRQSALLRQRRNDYVLAPAKTP